MVKFTCNFYKKDVDCLKKAGKFKKFICCTVAAICGVAFVTTMANAWVAKTEREKAQSYSEVEIDSQLVPQKDKNGNWVFTTDRNFKVMQLTDIHIGAGYMSYEKDLMAFNAVASMITREKPDLVIVTGDIAYPVPFQAGTFNNKSSAVAFAELMENLGVYWTLTLGNHDSEIYSYYSRESVSEIYMNEKYKHCLFETGPEDIDGYGNHVIEVKNTKGIITQAFVMMDSHSYTDGDYFGVFWKYDNIHQNQVDWYKTEIQRMNNENSRVIKSLQGDVNGGLFKQYGTVKTLAFFHIPLVEMLEGWTEFQNNNFKDTKDFKYIDGIIGETGKRIFPGVGEDGLFEAMLETDSTKGMFCGHDHYNNVTFKYKDVLFSYGNSVDYLAYIGVSKEGSQRGCTVITTKPDTTFTVEKFNYYSDRYDSEQFPREEVVMQFEDVTYQVAEE